MRPVLALAVVSLAALALGPGAAQPASQASKRASEYVVLYAPGATTAAGEAAVEAAGGTVVKVNGKIGLATVRSANPSFLLDVAQRAAIDGAARNRRIGYAPSSGRFDKFALERAQGDRDATAGLTRALRTEGKRVDAEPLADLQWDMKMIRATAKTSHRVEQGKRGVRVAVIDTGIDASHPDIAPNFNTRLSRHFTTDIPSVMGPCEDDRTKTCEQVIDGPCAEEPDRSCEDPPTVDESGHGTHVAGTIAAAINDFGIAGVAPKVTLVNLRAGQDSGFFFLQPSVDALTFAADHGIDVVNMSYFIDPWLFNCRNNPADSPEEQLEQRTIIRATQRALRYAHRHDVTLVSALGNEAMDISRPTIDTISPDFPLNSERERRVNNSCLTMPTEGAHVLGVSALGPTERKSWYSNYGRPEVFVSAPGGDSRAFFGTDRYRTPENLILSAYPENVARELGEIDEDGIPTTPFVVRHCKNGTCAYYTYFQGTSMASPHAAGVAALIVSEFGKRDRRRGGLRLDPDRTARIMKVTARDHACPRPRLLVYPETRLDPEDPNFLPPEINARCGGSREYNDFYGHGIVDALRAVRY